MCVKKHLQKSDAIKLNLKYKIIVDASIGCGNLKLSFDFLFYLLMGLFA